MAQSWWGQDAYAGATYIVAISKAAVLSLDMTACKAAASQSGSVLASAMVLLMTGVLHVHTMHVQSYRRTWTA